MPKPSTGPTSLYRFYDVDGTLLYIGITNQRHWRFQQHEGKEWWPQVATATVTHYLTRSEAQCAEAAAISAEHPVYNVVGNHAPGHITSRLAEHEQRLTERAIDAHREWTSQRDQRL